MPRHKKGCPLGSDTPNFGTKGEANKFIEKNESEKNEKFLKMSKNSNSLSGSSNGGGKNNNKTLVGTPDPDNSGNNDKQKYYDKNVPDEKQNKIIPKLGDSSQLNYSECFQNNFNSIIKEKTSINKLKDKKTVKYTRNGPKELVGDKYHGADFYKKEHFDSPEEARGEFERITNEKRLNEAKEKLLSMNKRSELRKEYSSITRDLNEQSIRADDFMSHAKDLRSGADIDDVLDSLSEYQVDEYPNTSDSESLANDLEKEASTINTHVDKDRERAEKIRKIIEEQAQLEKQVNSGGTRDFTPLKSNTIDKVEKIRKDFSEKALGTHFNSTPEEKGRQEAYNRLHEISRGAISNGYTNDSIVSMKDGVNKAKEQTLKRLERNNSKKDIFHDDDSYIEKNKISVENEIKVYDDVLKQLNELS